MSDATEQPESAARGPYQLLPPLTPEEQAQLEASIRTHGVEDPISVDEEGRTLDGHHRRAIADRLGVPYETRVITGLSGDEKRLYAIRRNTERRQLTKAQRALVALRAEPSFRTEAKDRQGSRTDLWPNPAERRRVWAAEEAARLVGLPLSTYKEYRALLMDAQRERGEEELGRAVEGGRWDIPELRALLAESRRQKEEEQRERRRQAVEERQERHVQAVHDDAKKRWDDHGLLGKPRREPIIDDDGFWQCADCEAYWPPALSACGTCGAPRPVEASPEPSLRTPWGRVASTPDPAPDPVLDPLPVTSPEPSPEPSRPGPEPIAQLPDTAPPVPRLHYRDMFEITSLREAWGDSFTKRNPEEVADAVVEEWQPSKVTKLRERVRVLVGWFSALDAALTAASVGQLPPSEPISEEPPPTPQSEPANESAA